MTRNIRTFYRSLPWLFNYSRQSTNGKIKFPTPEEIGSTIHFIIAIANHFEPIIKGGSEYSGSCKIESWFQNLRTISPLKDSDGFPLKFTYFFPAEQYSKLFLDLIAKECRETYGEVEVHLHHGVDEPDNSKNLREKLVEFIHRLEDHGLLSYEEGNNKPKYCFVHGNWALANSARGKFCGVDDEMQVLAETGCYMDCTMPCAPHIAQVPIINSIYQCGYPLNEACPHRSGIPLEVGQRDVKLPVLVQGPLLLNWGKKVLGMPFPGIENGNLSDYWKPSLERFHLWASANIHVLGRRDWVFIKLHTHSLEARHQDALYGDTMKNFLRGLLKRYNDGANYQIHFTTTRELSNIIFAAMDGKQGNPSQYRNYRYKLQ